MTSKDNQEGEKCEGKWESKSFVWQDDGDVDDSWLVVVVAWEELKEKVRFTSNKAYTSHM